MKLRNIALIATVLAVLIFVPWTPAQAQVTTQTASVQMKYVVQESLSVTLTGGPAVFVPVSGVPTTNPLTMTTTYNLTNEANLYEWTAVGSATAALSNGSVNVGSGNIKDTPSGGASPWDNPGQCNASANTDGNLSSAPAAVLSQANQTNEICSASATSLASVKAGTSTSTHTLSIISMVPTQAGTYTGTYNAYAFAF